MEERWGTLSVDDHNDTEKLIQDVLLFDRLVVPVPPDEGEKERWRTKGWNPEVQKERLATLGDRAIRVPWDQYRKAQFADRMATVRAISDDSETTIPTSTAYQMTRRILAQYDSLTLPPGVTSVTAVAAYHSVSALRENYLFDQDRTDRETLAVAFQYRLAQPVFALKPEKCLAKAVALSSDDDFQEKRRALYQWEKELLGEKIPHERAIEQLDQLLEKYNARVKEASDRVKYSLVFTIAGIGVALAGALLASSLASAPFALAAGGSVLHLVRFSSLERKPVIEPGEAKPAAMFHEVEKSY